jgi:hypothetical protein
VKIIAALGVATALAFAQGRMEAATPGRFEVLLPGRNGVSDMTVLLTDGTDLVGEMTAGGDSHHGAAISRVTGRNDQLVVEWLSGFCEDYTRLTLRTSGSGYVLFLTMETTPFHGGRECLLLVGIQRSVTLTLSTPVPPELIELRQ